MTSKETITGTKEDGKPVLVPKLRFPEFRGTEGWRTYSLGAVCDLYQPVTLSCSELSMSGEHLVYGANGIIGSHYRYNHEESEIAVTCRGATCGELTRTEPKSWITGNAMVVKPRARNLHKGFIFQYLKNDGLKSVISGSAQPQITRAGFAPLEVSYPTLPEQQKVAECLESLDEVIAAQARKVAALKTHKKGLMQQLFPREGETQPRLRFPEFEKAGEWEEHKLGDVCELYQPVTLSSSELTMTGEHLVYGANGVIGTHNEYNHADSEIAVTCRGATCGEVTRTQPMSWITGNAMVVRPRSARLAKDFVYQYFKNHGLTSVISGSAQPQITRAGFSPLPISFPTPSEQQRIAHCLSSLDALITADTQKLETLKRHKRGLTQQLFPSPEEVEA